ncbi:MAG: cyclic pyranopterin monophosphate synthase MoaC [Armatimonadetes bacterium]|nr:cyclic pyranopterin monophosphate synthase MoaC [Armatimonadota bacterium]MDE2205175.1 cyclic pyranopterin monophosphate synthase MoaC [Armatimonadota bacterium]
MHELSHLDDRGSARVVDVGPKAVTERRAIARGRVRLRAETIACLRSNTLPKGDAFAVARVAGIQGAKRCSDLIPLCHPLPISSIRVDIALDDIGAQIEAEVAATAKTGVEMEALTAVSLAALALYDMVKAIDRSAEITEIALYEKSGGVSGIFIRGADADE